MGTKISKLVLSDIANINISRFECSECNVLNVLRLFEFGAVIIEIGNVEKCSSLFQELESLNIHYIKSLDEELPCMDVILLTDICTLQEIIHHIFVSECEVFSVVGIKNSEEWERCLYKWTCKRQLIKHKIITVATVFETDESHVSITFYKDMYDIKQMISKIKEIC